MSLLIVQIRNDSQIFHREGNGGPYITISNSDVDRAVNHLTFQKVPEGKSAKNRVHLDMFVDDIAVEVERLVGLGAAVISPAGDPSHLGFVAVVLTDPEGGEFCVVGRPEHQPASNDSTIFKASSKVAIVCSSPFIIRSS